MNKCCTYLFKQINSGEENGIKQNGAYNLPAATI